MTVSLTPFQRRMIVTVTLLSSFLSVLMQFLLITAFPRIMTEFSVNSTQVQWLTTSFMMTVAILIPITAYFIDTFKTRTIMISAMLLFFIGTFVAFMAPSFSVLIIGRIIQGLGSGMMIPLMQTILYLIYPREKRGYAMGLAGMVINVAPAIGPPLSGIIINTFEWRYLFLLTLPIAAVVLILVFFYMQNITEQRKSEIDHVSIILSIIGFGSMLYGFTQWQEGGLGEPITAISLLVGAIAIGFFAVRQWRLPTPILELRVLQTPAFVVVALITVLSFSLLITIETILPMYVQNAQQFSAYYGGLIVMPGALTLAFMSFLAGKLFDQYGGKSIAIIGFVLLSLSTIGFYFILDLDTPFIVTMGLFMISMAGVALIHMPIMTAGINALPDELLAHGTVVINTIRQFGGTLGLTFIISFISRAEAGSDVIYPEQYLIGVKNAFIVACIFSILGLLLSFLLKTERQLVRRRT